MKYREISNFEFRGSELGGKCLISDYVIRV